MVAALVLFAVFAVGLPVWLLAEEIAHRFGAPRHSASGALRETRPASSARAGSRERARAGHPLRRAF